MTAVVVGPGGSVTVDGPVEIENETGDPITVREVVVSNTTKLIYTGDVLTSIEKYEPDLLGVLVKTTVLLYTGTKLTLVENTQW